MRDLAQAFRVNLKSVARWVARFRATGDVAPKPHGGGRPRKIPAAACTILRDLVARQPDATLAELSTQLAATTGVTASPPRVCEALAALELPRKKSRRTPASSTGPTSRSSAPSSRSRRPGSIPRPRS